MGIEDVVLGRSPDSKQGDSSASFVEGRITLVGTDGAYYAVPDWDNGKHTFGPSPYPTGATIEIGYRCLVLMPNNEAESVAEPWIIGVWPNG